MKKQIKYKKRVSRQVFETTDYGQFEFMRVNRRINPAYVKRLAGKISEHNLLHDFPIVVSKNKNGKWTVLDGQHRLAAAEMLRVPIYYVVDGENFDLQQVIRINEPTPGWKWNDFIDAYKKLGKRDYGQLREFKEESGLSYSLCISLLTGDMGQAGGGTLQKFRAGNFRIKSYDGARRVANIVNAFRQHGIDYAIHRSFIVAIAKLCTIPTFDEGRLIGKLEHWSHHLDKRSTFGQYVELLEKIYNSGVQRRHLVSLALEVKRA